jgi:hypothetical protein
MPKFGTRPAKNKKGQQKFILTGLSEDIYREALNNWY